MNKTNCRGWSGHGLHERPPREGLDESVVSALCLHSPELQRPACLAAPHHNASGVNTSLFRFLETLLFVCSPKEHATVITAQVAVSTAFSQRRKWQENGDSSGLSCLGVLRLHCLSDCLLHVKVSVWSLLPFGALYLYLMCNLFLRCRRFYCD